MKRYRNIALAWAATICGSISSANAEKWSCEMVISGKTFKQEWIVSDDKMFAPKGVGYYRVELNNDDTLVAFAKDWPDPKTTASSTEIILISKRTGVVTELVEIPGLDFGKQPHQWMPPFLTVGHCSLDQP